MRNQPGKLLLLSILGMTAFQKDLFGTGQRSLLDIPPKHETDKWYADRATEKRKRRAANKAANIAKSKPAMT